ncbi:MAG: hypothetical protein ABEH43_07645 [Flavobacteriales bacterium]
MIKNTLIYSLSCILMIGCSQPQNKKNNQTTKEKTSKKEKTNSSKKGKNKLDHDLTEPKNVKLPPKGEVSNKQEQIDLAVKAAPKNKRKNASVLGYNDSNKVVTLRKGSNQFVCLADDPSDKRFSVACYHKDLEPFMARGRELRRKGKTRSEVRKIRGKEIKSGKLPMPEKSTLNVLNAKYNEETGKLSDKYLRYVVYIPFETKESTGLPDEPTSPGGPWIMDAGTHKSHIMINPKK